MKTYVSFSYLCAPKNNNSMKKAILAFVIPTLVISCGQPQKSVTERLYDRYAEVEIGTKVTTLMDGMSENGKEVLNLYRFAAMEIDSIYWRQMVPSREAVENIVDEAQRQYAMLNYGPWDRLDGSTFASGFGDRPLGANFYPEDMTLEEFEAFDDSLKYSPYTLIRRDSDGNLKTVWYHDEYKEYLDKARKYLTAAAYITIKPSVKSYLLGKEQALATDDYEENDLEWMGVNDSRMDIVIGPYESSDDHLLGIKKSYEAYVLLNNEERTATTRKYLERMEEYQNMLPCKEEYKSSFVPGPKSELLVCDALYHGGLANAGIKLIGISNPDDVEIQEKAGTRTHLMYNLIIAKYDKIIHPVAQIILDREQGAQVDQSAFFWYVVFREIAHELGVKTTQDGKYLSQALGSYAQVMEDVKSDIVGAWLETQLTARHDIPWILTEEDVITTFTVSMIRSGAFGVGESVGQANLICYNYMKEKGAFTRNEAGVYDINYPKAKEAMASLAADVLEIQALGDAAAAKAMVEKYAVVAPELKGDFRNIRLEGIPSDIRFKFSWN